MKNSLNCERKVFEIYKIKDYLSTRGGEWLGLIRSFIQWKFKNGETVTWGSLDHLIGGSIIVRDLELIAQDIAASAIFQVQKHENKICNFCINKNPKYKWDNCELEKNFDKAIENSKCDYFELKKDIIILNLE